MRRAWNALRPTRASRRPRCRQGSGRRRETVSRRIVDRADDKAGEERGPRRGWRRAAETKRHGETPSFLDGGAASAQPKLGIEGAEEDVRDVERPERPFLEDRLELVAVAGPPAGGIQRIRSDLMAGSRRAGGGPSGRTPTGRGVAPRGSTRRPPSGDTADVGRPGGSGSIRPCSSRRASAAYSVPAPIGRPVPLSTSCMIA